MSWITVTALVLVSGRRCRIVSATAGAVPQAAAAYDAVIDSVALIPICEDHLEAIGELADDPLVQRFTRVPSPPPPDFARSWLDFYQQGRAEGSREAFAIVEAATEGFLGIAVAPRIDQVARTAELGYVLVPQARGRGVASTALRLLTQWAFSELEALRLELLISVENQASQRVAARCGYVREGVLRSLHVKQDVREDTEIWSLLPSD
jgi:RimJ/RimL family protein N-acetyltransferase